MIYLIIPVICFVLFARVFWKVLGPNLRTKKFQSPVDGLDLILSVLMTTGLTEQNLLMKTHGGDTGLKITFPDSAVRLEMPLATRLKQSRREHYLEICRNLDLEAHVSIKSG